MRVLREFQQYVGDHVIKNDKSVDRIMYEVDLEIKQFKKQWPGNYDLYATLESYHSLIIGVKFKTVEDLLWHKIRWS